MNLTAKVYKCLGKLVQNRDNYHNSTRQYYNCLLLALCICSLLGQIHATETTRKTQTIIATVKIKTREYPLKFTIPGSRLEEQTGSTKV